MVSFCGDSASERGGDLPEARHLLCIIAAAGVVAFVVFVDFVQSVSYEDFA